MPDTLPPLSPIKPWSIIGGGPHDGETREPAAPAVMDDDGRWIAHARTATAPLNISSLTASLFTAAGAREAQEARFGFVYVYVTRDGVPLWLYLGEHP